MICAYSATFVSHPFRGCFYTKMTGDFLAILYEMTGAVGMNSRLHRGTVGKRNSRVGWPHSLTKEFVRIMTGKFLRILYEMTGNNGICLMSQHKSNGKRNFSLRNKFFAQLD